MSIQDVWPLLWERQRESSPESFRESLFGGDGVIGLAGVRRQPHGVERQTERLHLPFQQHRDFAAADINERHPDVPCFRHHERHDGAEVERVWDTRLSPAFASVWNRAC